MSRTKRPISLSMATATLNHASISFWWVHLCSYKILKSDQHSFISIFDIHLIHLQTRLIKPPPLSPKPEYENGLLETLENNLDCGKNFGLNFKSISEDSWSFFKGTEIISALDKAAEHIGKVSWMESCRLWNADFKYRRFISSRVKSFSRHIADGIKCQVSAAAPYRFANRAAPIWTVFRRALSKMPSV